MSAFVLIVAFLGSIAGGFTLLGAFGSASSAPEQAAASAAIAVGLAVIPYVFARCVQLTVQAQSLKELQSKVLDRLDAIERAASRTTASGG